VAELEAEGIGASAVPGEKSQFDVVSDGSVVFSKQQIGRFPDPGEVAQLMTAPS